MRNHQSNLSRNFLKARHLRPERRGKKNYQENESADHDGVEIIIENLSSAGRGGGGSGRSTKIRAQASYRPNCNRAKT